MLVKHYAQGCFLLNAPKHIRLSYHRSIVWRVKMSYYQIETNVRFNAVIYRRQMTSVIQTVQDAC